MLKSATKHFGLAIIMAHVMCLPTNLYGISSPNVSMGAFFGGVLRFGKMKVKGILPPDKLGLILQQSEELTEAKNTIIYGNAEGQGPSIMQASPAHNIAAVPVTATPAAADRIPQQHTVNGYATIPPHFIIGNAREIYPVLVPHLITYPNHNQVPAHLSNTPPIHNLFSLVDGGNIQDNFELVPNRNLLLQDAGYTNNGEPVFVFPDPINPYHNTTGIPAACLITRAGNRFDAPIDVRDRVDVAGLDGAAGVQITHPAGVQINVVGPDGGPAPVCQFRNGYCPPSAANDINWLRDSYARSYFKGAEDAIAALNNLMKSNADNLSNVSEYLNGLDDYEFTPELTSVMRGVRIALEGLVQWQISGTMFSIGLATKIGFSFEEYKNPKEEKQIWKDSQNFYTSLGLVIGFSKYIELQAGFGVARHKTELNTNEYVKAVNLSYAELKDVANALKEGSRILQADIKPVVYRNGGPAFIDAKSSNFEEAAKIMDGLSNGLSISSSTLNRWRVFFYTSFGIKVPITDLFTIVFSVGTENSLTGQNSGNLIDNVPYKIKSEPVKLPFMVGFRIAL